MDKVESFSDWSDKELAKHEMSKEWWKKQKERKIERESNMNYWIEKFKESYQEEKELMLSSNDCKELLDIFMDKGCMKNE